MKLCYLNPQHPDLSLENEVLGGTGIELVACAVRGEDEIIRATGDADAIVTNEDAITARIAERLERCQVIVRLGVGYDAVDVEACQKRGILVCNVPDYGTEEVANHAHALLFAVHRRLLQYDRVVRAGKWGHVLPWPIRRLSTLRAGLVGLGRIGTLFARGLRPFVREIVAYDPFLSADQFAERGLIQAALPEIYETCDFISLHLPLSKETHHLIADPAIAQMKRQPILINVSRGGLIDGTALCRALQKGQISGAGIDVFEDEPNVPAELRELDNLVLSPHVAWYSEEASAQLRRSAVEEIVRVLQGDPPKHPVSAK